MKRVDGDGMGEGEEDENFGAKKALLAGGPPVIRRSRQKEAMKGPGPPVTGASDGLKGAENW